MARPRLPGFERARRVADFEEFIARGASPSRAWREAGLRIADVNAELGRGAYRRAVYAHAHHRGGQAMQVPFRDGWHAVRVYGREDRVLLGRYANSLRLYADGDRHALDPFEGKTIMTSSGRVELLTDGRTIAALERKDELRGQVDRLYLAR